MKTGLNPDLCSGQRWHAPEEGKCFEILPATNQPHSSPSLLAFWRCVPLLLFSFSCGAEGPHSGQFGTRLGVQTEGSTCCTSNWGYCDPQCAFFPFFFCHTCTAKLCYSRAYGGPSLPLPVFLFSYPPPPLAPTPHPSLFSFSFCVRIDARAVKTLIKLRYRACHLLTRDERIMHKSISKGRFSVGSASVM